jgi:hypothetical protein
MLIVVSAMRAYVQTGAVCVDEEAPPLLSILSTTSNHA